MIGTFVFAGSPSKAQEGILNGVLAALKTNNPYLCGIECVASEWQRGSLRATFCISNKLMTRWAPVVAVRAPLRIEARFEHDSQGGVLREILFSTTHGTVELRVQPDGSDFLMSDEEAHQPTANTHSDKVHAIGAVLFGIALAKLISTNRRSRSKG